MRRLALFIIACAALVLGGCTKANEGGGGSKSVYKIWIKANTDHVTLSEKNPVTAEFYPRTSDDGVDTDITITFKADPSLASKYTAEPATLLPATNYEFLKNTSVIKAYNRYDMTGKEMCQLKISYTKDLAPETLYVIPVVIEGITGNSNASFDPNDILFVTVKTTKGGAGSGTVDDPYRIATLEDLSAMPEYVISGQITYFRLENDLDFSSVENWDPINLDSENPFYIDFNGNGKTLKNFKCTDKEGASIFGSVSGNIYDLKIDNATVTAQDSAFDTAILANVFGVKDENFPSECNNVSITNSKVMANFADNGSLINQAFVAIYAKNATFSHIVIDKSNTMKLYFYASSSSMSNGLMAGGLVARGDNVCNFIQCGNAVDLDGYNQKQIGGIVGSLLSGHISECWNTGIVSGNEDVGGIVGQMGSKKGSNIDADEWTIKNCYNKGLIKITGQRGGGICGCPFNSVKIEDCYNIGDVMAVCRKLETGEDNPDKIDGRCIGGIAGHVCGGAGFWDFNIGNFVSIINSHVYSKLVMADTGDKTEERPGCGAIVGYTSLRNTYTDCFRSSATKVDNDRTLNPHDPFDQANCSPDNPLNTGSIAPVQKWAIPYHGVASDKATIAELISTCGWDASIWDFGTATLKNNPEK